MLSDHFSAVLICDFQEDLILNLSKGGVQEVPAYFKDMMALNKEANACGMRVYATHFVNPDPNFKKALGWASSGTTRLLSKVSNVQRITQKTNYKIKDTVIASLASHAFNDDKPVLVVGMETDATVMAACFDLWEQKVDFKVSKAHVRSTNPEANQAALFMLDKQFKCLINDAMSLPGPKAEEKAKKESIDQVLADLWDVVARVAIRMGRAIFG